MKIDFYISSLSCGGAEHVLVNLAADFVDRGHEISIVSYEKRPQFYPVTPKVRVDRYDHTQKSFLWELTADFSVTCRHIRESRADVAISFLSRCNLMLILAGLFSRTKIIVCDRNNLRMKYPGYVFVLSCWLYALTDGVCVQTNESKTSYPRFLQKKIFVLENPLDFYELEEQCQGEKVLKEKTVISVGRLEKQKDFVTLIRAFAGLVPEHPGWKLKIFGQGNRRKELQTLINDLKLEEQVELCSVTRRPFLEMKKAQVFVLSSFYEGFPNVLCEAMYAGLPCIATRCNCGPAELIEDGKNGFLVDVGDAEVMAERMKQLMENGELRKIMSEKAKKSVLRLERKKICEKWLEMVGRVRGKQI